MRPIIGITMGDPFGNGPEISVKALSDGKLYERARPLVIGDYSSMIYAAKVHERLTGQHLDINVVEKPEEAKFKSGTIDLLDLDLVPAGSIPYCFAEPKPFGIGNSELGGEASFQYVRKVIELALDGVASIFIDLLKRRGSDRRFFTFKGLLINKLASLAVSITLPPPRAIMKSGLYARQSSIIFCTCS